MKCGFCFIVPAVIVFLQCSHWTRDYSILDSSPYTDYCSNIIPESLDGPLGMGFCVGIHYHNTSTDVDTSVDATVLNMVLRSRLFEIFESGIAITGTFNDDNIYGHSAFDLKINLAEPPLCVCPDLGFGMGPGKIAWIYSIRPALAFGYEVVKDNLTVYAAPRYLGLMYPWHAEGSGITTSYSYALASAYGISGGFSLSFSIGSSHDDARRKIKFKPEVTYFWCREPKLSQMELSVLQIGCQFCLSF